MFEQAVVTGYVRGNRTWSTVAGMAVQTALLAAAVVVPLMSPEVLPNYRNLIRIFSPGGPPPPPPPPGEAVKRAAPEHRSQMVAGKIYEPEATRVPPKAVIIDDPVDTVPAGGVGVQGGVKGGVEGGKIGGVLHGILNSDARAALPPPVQTAPPARAAAPEATPPAPKQVEVGGKVQEAKLIRRVIPTYPVLARQARIQGVVELVGIVATDGRIKELRALRGHPLLVPAALDAVRQWIYSPTLLNGSPVEVICPITVFFHLN